MNFTQAFVKRVTCEEGKSKQEFYDSNIKAFYIRGVME